MKKLFFDFVFDKWFHIMVSIIIACVVALIDTIEWHRAYVVSATIGSVVALCVGILKDIVWDFILRRGTFDVKDLYADLTGSLTGFFLLWALLSIGGV